MGTDHSYSNCENKPLESGQEYVFFLLAELSSTTGVSQTFRGFFSSRQSRTEHFFNPPFVALLLDFCRTENVRHQRLHRHSDDPGAGG